MLTLETANSHDVLNSWKEIARYLARGVRTVQRWEADLALPVRRPRGKSRSAVLAIRSEIDGWLNSRPLGAIDSIGPRKHQERLNQNETRLNMVDLMMRSRA